MSKQITSTLSWGSTRVKVGGKTEVISARNRLRSLNHSRNHL